MYLLEVTGKVFILIFLLTIFVYLILYFLYDFEFIYFLAFGLMIVGIDLFTIGTFDSIKHNKCSVALSYLLLLLSIGMIILNC